MVGKASHVCIWCHHANRALGKGGMRLQLRSDPLLWSHGQKRIAKDEVSCLIFRMIISLVREYLQTSTIYGLNYISSARSVAAKAIWVVIVCVSFGIAICLINNAYKEWQDWPIDTTITTTPISDLVFPKVPVCPQGESNTILNLPLQAVKNDSFTKQEKDHLLDASFKTFLKNPNQKTKHCWSCKQGNLMGLYEGTTSQPAISAK